LDSCNSCPCRRLLFGQSTPDRMLTMNPPAVISGRRSAYRVISGSMTNCDSAVKSGYRNVSPLMNGLEVASNFLNGGLLRPPVYGDSSKIAVDVQPLKSNLASTPSFTNVTQQPSGILPDLSQSTRGNGWARLPPSVKCPNFSTGATSAAGAPSSSSRLPSGGWLGQTGLAVGSGRSTSSRRATLPGRGRHYVRPLP